MRSVLIPLSCFDSYIESNYLQDHKAAISLARWFINGQYWVQLPRWVDKAYPDPNILVTSHPDESKAIEADFIWELRDYQVEPMQQMMASYHAHGYLSGVLQALPGAGKTAMSAYLACQIKRKVLVLLDNSTLIPQWEDAFLQATTIKSVGRIQGTTFDVEHPVVIAMVQTLMNRAMDQDKAFMQAIRDAGFSVVFIDEVHKSGVAEKYAKSTSLMNRIHNFVGLTATLPSPSSTHHFMLTHNIGPVICTMKGQEDKPTMVFVHYKSGLDRKQCWAVQAAHDGFTTKTGVRVLGDYVRAIAKYNSLIVKDSIYLELIADAVNYLYSLGHRVIVITNTIKQIEAIVKIIRTKYGSLHVTPFHGKQPNIDKTKDKIIVATAKKASAGFDYEELSALILTTPMKGAISLIQTGGRILRSSTGKVTPVIYDLIDHNVPALGTGIINKKMSVFHNQYGKIKRLDYHHSSLTS